MQTLISGKRKGRKQGKEKGRKRGRKKQGGEKEGRESLLHWNWLPYIFITLIHLSININSLYKNVKDTI